MKAPDVDSIDNLRPSLNVSQSYYNFNPRSTVGTVTEVSHGLRSLFALIVSWRRDSGWTTRSSRGTTRRAGARSAREPARVTRSRSRS